MADSYHNWPIKTLKKLARNVRILTFYLQCTLVIEMCFTRKKFLLCIATNCFKCRGNDRNLQARGHSSTTWTKFYPILTPSPDRVDNCGYFIWYLPFVTWSSVDFLLTSYPRSYWMAPNWYVETDMNKATKIWRNVPIAHSLFFELYYYLHKLE